MRGNPEVCRHALFNIERASSSGLSVRMGALGDLLFVGVDTVSATAELVRRMVDVVVGGLIVVMCGQYIFGRVSVELELPGTESVTRWLTGSVERLARRRWTGARRGGGNDSRGVSVRHTHRGRRRDTPPLSAPSARGRLSRAGLHLLANAPITLGHQGPHPRLPVSGE
jgi:hypothetical protein